MPPITNIARICENVRASPALPNQRDDVFTVVTLPVIPPPPASQRPYILIPRLPNFTCTFVREIQTIKAAAVLLVALPNSNHRILKLFPPPRPSRPWDPLLRESTGYASQRRLRPLLPRLDRNHLAAPAAAGVSRRAFKQHKHLRGLQIDFIPNATTLMATPDRLVEHPALVDAVIAGQERIHEAGVLHQDTLPRNIMVNAHDRGWWIDFGSALSTATQSIDLRQFEAEREAMWALLLQDVVRSARE
ncbi:hypothetical protein FN846DRAFT_991542 [Sphaerosporella brunnea]|uniref:Protein kinase domain-containing protein n=1 Tax=Sphaerosporella brunnea TaxID=1250544 RepID=A0A5J5EP60_9PEZI|nr:hypothetical protein FN846DRAFT_991542 [Sphaerosporella brunnea]